MNLFDWMKNIRISDITFINTYVAFKSNYPMNNKGRYRHGLLYTVSGTEKYHFSDRNISASANTVLYIPEGEKYEIEFSGEKGVVITIDFELLSEGGREAFLIGLPNENEIKPCFIDAEKNWFRKRDGYNITCMSLLYKIFASLIKYEDAYLNSKKYSKINGAVNYLHKHYTESDFKIGGLSGMSNISLKYFETLFKQKFKMTPKEYVIMLKIERAKGLLLNEKHSVGEIAAQLGYCDIYHFCKTFKNQTGCTPSEFRQNR